MKKNKKYILGSILVLLSIILIVVFAINVVAEDATEATAKEIENEKHLVKRAASVSRGLDENDQVNKETLVELLNKYAGGGVTSVTEKSSDTLAVTFVASGREYEVNINSGPMISGAGAGEVSTPEGGGTETELPSTEYTTPYLPTGFTPLTGTDLSTGLVIQDGLGNQYVWVEVPRTSTVYPNAGLSITAFTDTEYTSIENDLHTYTSVYRNSTSFIDTWYSEDATGLTSGEYYELKNKMLKSVYQNGGFYIGRYEAGTDTARVSKTDTLTTPVTQANVYPYNYVTNSQAQSLARGILSGEYNSSLMFGVQWDLVLKYLETKGATQSELSSNSTEWGNYSNNIYNIINTSAKYSKPAVSSEWTLTPYNKTTSGQILLTTGASSEFIKQNINDLAGNVWEWTLENSTVNGYPCACRGGAYTEQGRWYTASNRVDRNTTWSYPQVGFRVSFY